MIMVFGYDSGGCSRVWAIEALKLRSPEFYMYSLSLFATGGFNHSTLRDVVIGMDSAKTASTLTGIDLGHNVLQFTLT